MRRVGQACGVRGLRPIQNGLWSGVQLLLVVLAEFRRARAAEQRYEQLTRASAAALALDGIAPADIPQRIFHEFYALTTEPRCGPGAGLNLSVMFDQLDLNSMEPAPMA